MRGKGNFSQRNFDVPGITPACAGKRSAAACARFRAWDHPRVCGEKNGGFCGSCFGAGSPPRVRGKGGAVRDSGAAVGITPACAGKRTRGSMELPMHRDHPRVCGEKHMNTLTASCAEGSPPRVRGKVCNPFSTNLNARITPACAGKSQLGIAVQPLTEDHPRVCGEKADACFYTALRIRITPACAGKSLPALPSIVAKRDHPRVCGEKRG